MPTDSMGLALAGVLLLSGCGGAQTSRTSLSSHTDVGEVPPDLQGDYESFATNCSKCHDLDRALNAPVTDNRHWDMYVAKMMRTAGSAIKPEEAPHILRFLYWYTEQRKSGGNRVQVKASGFVAPPSAPAPVAPPAVPPAPPTKEEMQAPAPNVSSETQGESTP